MRKISRGITIPVVLLIIVIVMIIGAATAIVANRHSLFVNKDKFNTRAFYVAEAGLSRGIAQLKENSQWDGTTDDQPTFEKVSMQNNPDDTFTIRVYNNFEGTSDMTAEKGITVPARSCYIISEGWAGDRSQKFVGCMLTYGSAFDYGLFGDVSLKCGGTKLVIDSYNSATQPPPTTSAGTLTGEADVGVNASGEGVVTFSGNVVVDGGISVGPGADINTAVIPSGDQTLETVATEITVMKMQKELPPVEIPDGLVWNPIPAGAGGKVATEITLLPGAYNAITKSDKEVYILKGNGGTSETPNVFYFKGINLSGGAILKVDNSQGPIVVYVDGNIDLTGQSASQCNVKFSDTSSNPRPTDLRIYGTDKCTSVNMVGSSSAFWAVYAPNASVSLKGDSAFYGSAVGETIVVQGNPAFYYDISLKDTNDLKIVNIGSFQRF